MKKFMSFLKDEDGQGMVEYALIIGAIAVVAIVILIAMRTKISAMFQKTNTAMDQVLAD